MKKHSFIIDSDDSFFKYLEHVSHDSYMVFRGITSEKYKLIPKIGRHKVTGTSFNKLFNSKEEKLILDLFIQRAFSYLSNIPDSVMERMVLAQHYGVPTRLLDWSYNPLIAAFFAVEQYSKDNSLIYYTKLPKNNILNVTFKIDPFKIRTPKFYFPNHSNDRIKAQWGLFTISPDPYKQLSIKNLKSAIIKNEYRKRLKKLLYTLGVHYAMIYPDMEGIGKHLYWLRTDIY